MRKLPLVSQNIIILGRLLLAGRLNTAAEKVRVASLPTYALAQKTARLPLFWYALDPEAKQPPQAKEVVWQIALALDRVGLLRSAIDPSYNLFRARVQEFRRFLFEPVWRELETCVFQPLPVYEETGSFRLELLETFELDTDSNQRFVKLGREVNDLELSLFCVAILSLYEIKISTDLLEEYSRGVRYWISTRTYKELILLSLQEVRAYVRALSYALPGAKHRQKFSLLIEDVVLTYHQEGYLTRDQFNSIELTLFEVWRNT